MILVDPLLLVSRLLKVFELCLSSPQSHLFLLYFETAKTVGIGSEPCFPPLEWLVGSVSKVGTTSVWRTLCPPGDTLVHVLASMARCCILLCCVYVCVRAVVYVYVCVLYLCVYVALCPFMFVFDGVFGFFW